MNELPEHLRQMEQIWLMQRSRDPMERMYGYYTEQRFHKHDIALWVLHPKFFHELYRHLSKNYSNSPTPIWEIRDRKQILGAPFVINKDAPEDRPLIINKYDLKEVGVELK